MNSKKIILIILVIISNLYAVNPSPKNSNKLQRNILKKYRSKFKIFLLLLIFLK